MLTSLQGAYTLAEKVLGKGTYGKVRVATCEATGCEYACKTIDKASPDCNDGRRVRCMDYQHSGAMSNKMCFGS